MYGLPVHIHRDARQPAGGLARPVDDERELDTRGEDDAVGEEGRAVDEHVLGEVDERLVLANVVKAISSTHDRSSEEATQYD